jgi:hypothetical protein
MPGCAYNNIYRDKDRRLFPSAAPLQTSPVAAADGKKRLPIFGS